MCSRTPYCLASTALSLSSSPDTEKGEQGARAICRIEPFEGSWYFSMSLTLSFIISSMVCTTLSGGRPPSFLERSMLPREACIRIPIRPAASNWAAIRSPPSLGNT